jgi:hypothetical protein
MMKNVNAILMFSIYNKYEDDKIFLKYSDMTPESWNSGARADIHC